MFKIGEFYSREDQASYYGYDLDRHTYLGRRYVVTDLNLEGLMPMEALEKLLGYSGFVESFKTKDGVKNMLNGKKTGTRI